MTHAKPSSKPPVVFISYAYESEDLRLQVKRLADWLAEKRCVARTDHPYIDRPPAPGWLVWMMNCIREADAVLVVCTPKLKERYERTAPPGAGRGATFEGAIVTQLIYDQLMHNTKFFPILPDGGDDADIPLPLRQWSTGHRFPSGRDGILRLVLAPSEVPSGGTHDRPRDDYTPPFAITSKHQEFVLELLDGSDVGPFLSALIAELRADNVQTATSADVVRYFAEEPPHASAGEAVLDRFDYVRRALRAPMVSDTARRAAAALYCLAACSLVNRETAEKQVQASGSRFVLQVPAARDLILAVTAVALFGGRLELQDDSANHSLCGRHVYRVSLPVSGDWAEHDFERVMLATLSANDENLPELTQGTGPLTDAQRATLRARLRGIRRTHRHAFALVVPGSTDPTMVRTIADRHGAPVLISSPVASEMFGMDAAELDAEVDEFLREYRAEPPKTQSNRPSGGPSPDFSTRSSVAMHVSGGNVVVSTGEGSVAQAGSTNRVHQGIGEIADLLPLIRELVAAVQATPSSGARASLEAVLTSARAEAEKGASANPGAFKRALDGLKAAKDGIEGGEKIVELCDRLLRAAGPLLVGFGSQL